jgi:F-box/WD-40 domain protein MET30
METFVAASASSALPISNIQTVSPYLVKHVPHKYNPEASVRPITTTLEHRPTYCNRHRPDTKCWRQANEPTMEELQKEISLLDHRDQEGISRVWSLFSTAPSAHRKLMLQGILAVCCFPQLSYIADSVQNLIKIDFVSMLPSELSFQILGYLDSVSLCKAAQVSKSWNQVAEDDVVWHKMCEQHIAKKCKRCGWGLPLLDQKRLFKEKDMIQQRAQGRIEPPEPPTTESCSQVILSTKRPLDEPTEPLSKKSRHSSKRPWKEVYKMRYRVSNNWKHMRYKLKVLKGHQNSVMCLDLQDNILATASYDTTIKIWDVETGKEIRTLVGHTSGVRTVQFSGPRLFSGSMDKTIRIWNWQTGELVRVFRNLEGDILSVNFAGQWLVSGGKDHKVRIWDFETTKHHCFTAHRDFVNCVKIDLPSKTVFSAGDDGVVNLWDLTGEHRLIKTYSGHVGGIQQITLLPHEFDLDEFDLLDCAHQSDTEDESGRNSPLNPSVLPNTPLLSDGRPNPPQFMLTASLDTTIRLWHIPTGRCLRTVSLNSEFCALLTIL